MKKIIGFALFFLLFAQSTIANDAFKKASLFTKVNDLKQAQKVLRAEYEKNPGAKVLYLLGTAYLSDNMLRYAIESYEKAIIFDPSYKNKIANRFADQGSLLFLKGNTNTALKCFREAIKYCSDYSRRLPLALIKNGKNYLSKDTDLNNAMNYFNAAKAINSEFNEEIANYLWNVSKLFKEDTVDNMRARALFFYKYAEFSKSKSSQIGKEFVRMAKMSSTSTDLKASFKKSAKDFLSKTEYEKNFPPPPPKTWQVVREITKKGEGLGEKDYFIVFSEPGKIKAGDRIDVYSKNALVWYKRAWRKTKKGVYSYTIKKLGTRSGVAVRAPRGQQYSVKIFRLK